MKISVSKSHAASLHLDAVAFPIEKERSQKALEAIYKMTGLPEKSIDEDFKADAGEIMVVYPQDKAFASKRVICLGLGDKVTNDSIRKAASALGAKANAMKLSSIGVDLSGVDALAKLASESEAYVAQVFVEGFEHGLYDFTQLKTDRIESLKKGKKGEGNKKHEVKELQLVTEGKFVSELKEGAEIGHVISSSQAMVRDLINLPGNHMTATDLAAAAKASGRKYGYAVTVLDKRKLESLGMGGLLGVNRGSSNPPTFSILEYKPKTKAKAKIAIVGKGVTFDTGGISLKPSDGMGDMKADMSGAADVIGAVEIAARLKLPIHVIGAIPATDNMPSGSAQNPGDVLKTYSGITVEVDNTDAEGRLILSDALTYVKEKYSPDAIVDLATLTGACVVALGNQVAGLFSNNDDLADKIYKAGLRSGEKVWRMPIWDDYDPQIKSDVADLKNVGGRGAGAITAAKFLEKFVGDHKSWAHLDIAGPAFPGMGGGSKQKGSTGFGVRLLAELLRNWS